MGSFGIEIERRRYEQGVEDRGGRGSDLIRGSHRAYQATRQGRRLRAGPGDAGRGRHTSGIGPAAPGGPGRGQVHSLQDDGPDPRGTEEGIRGQAGRGVHRRVEEPERRQAVRHQADPDADLLRRHRQGTLPARGLLLQGGHPGQVEGARRGPVGTQFGTPAFERLTACQARRAPEGEHLLHVRRRHRPQDARDREDGQRAGPAVRSALLLHHVLVPDRGQDRLREEGHRHRLGHGQAGPALGGRLSVRRGRDDRPTLDQGLRRPGRRRRGASRRRRKRPGPGGARSRRNCPTAAASATGRAIRRTPPR